MSISIIPGYISPLMLDYVKIESLGKASILTGLVSLLGMTAATSGVI